MSLKPFAGTTWTFVREDFEHTENGRIVPDERKFEGVLIYTTSGHMCIYLRRVDLAPDEPLANDEFFAYYGTYTANEVEHTITHHVLGSYVAAWIGHDQLRTFTISGDEVTLVTPPAVVNGQTVRRRLVWKRAPEQL